MSEKMNAAFLYIFLTISSVVIGQLLVKKGMSVSGPMPEENILSIARYLLTTLMLNCYNLLGIAFAFLGALLWLGALKKTELSIAYPMLALTYPLVLLGSVVFFQESISWTRWFGVLVIIIGIIIVSRG